MIVMRKSRLPKSAIKEIYILFFIGIFLCCTYFINMSYMFALQIFFLKAIYFGYLIGWVIQYLLPLIPFVKIKIPIKAPTLALSFFIASVVFINVPQLLPSMEGNEKGLVQENQIYVTYDHDCEYCKASYNAVKKASFIYNQSKLSGKVQLVNLKHDTGVATSLRQTLNRKGTVSKINRKGIYMHRYSIGDTNENPISNTPTYIYEKIQELNKN